MVWHIVKKDVRLLWKWIVLVALMQATNAAASVILGTYFMTYELVIYLIPLFGLMILAALAVQQDSLTDVRQDWHVRPIPRRDLLLAKVLFVLLVGHGPLFLADFSCGLILGHPVLRSASVAALRAVATFCLFSLPAVALATLTRTALGMLGAWFALMLGQIVTSVVTGRGLSWWANLGFIVEHPPRDSGLAWITVWIAAIIALLAAGAVLPLRYTRRSTVGALGIVVGAAFFYTIISFTYWAPAFAVQQRLSPMPELASRISLVFDPGATVDSGRQLVLSRDDIRIELPTRVFGLPENALLIQDNAVVQLIAADGTRVLTTQTGQLSSRLTVHGDMRVVHSVPFFEVPAQLYARIKNDPLLVEIDYALTLFTLDSIHELATSNVPQKLGDVGLCTARAVMSGVEVQCTSLGKTPYCIQRVLERWSDEFDPLRITMSCSPSYAPIRMSIFPSVVQSFGTPRGGALGTLYAVPHSSGWMERTPVPAQARELIPAEAPAQIPAEAPAQIPAEAPAQIPAEAPVQMPAEALVQIPAEAPVQIPAEALALAPVRSVVLEAYAPRVHFTRKLVIPGLRLSDLESKTKGP